MNERWEKIERLYHAACELDRDQQGRFLDEAWRSDAPLWIIRTFVPFMKFVKRRAAASL